MDELRISNVAVEPQGTAFWMLWWFWTAAVAVGGAILFGVIYFLRKRKTRTGVLTRERQSLIFG